MIDFLFLVPIALAMGGIGLVAFLWALRNGQYEDLDGAAVRILFTDGDKPHCPSTGPANRPPSKGRRSTR